MNRAPPFSLCQLVVMNKENLVVHEYIIQLRIKSFD